MSVCLPTILILFNLMFFIHYPNDLALAIISAIPKKGSLLHINNYRGIHVQKLLALLYDRVIAKRLIAWAVIHAAQTAFQKGKSTLNQIFVLRVLIALIKQANLPLFIGFFDLEKAFDKVSRPELLKSLIKLGIGSGLLNAIKAMYSVTKCSVKVGNKLSEVFNSYSGIKQGAPSSVILFIIFMDGFIDIVRQKCVKEPILDLLHLLLHADDMAVLSTNRELFIKKCNVLIDAFEEKKVTLNLKKSGFLVINPSSEDDRRIIKLKNGWLNYCSEYVYLGVIISDEGTVGNDIDLHVKDRQKTVLVKLSNFVHNNPTVPIIVKKKVLQSCLNASLLYGCEAWGGSSLLKVETLFRKAVKITYGMINNTPNEIAFIESGEHEHKAQVYKRQFSFWKKVKDSIALDPDNEVSKLISLGINKNVTFLRHYKKLHRTFASSTNCSKFWLAKQTELLKSNLQAKLAAPTCGTIIADYVKINPTLVPPGYADKFLLESDRRVLTKYRCGCNFLKINAGRHSHIPRERRLCKCGQIQSLHHVIFDCALTQPIRIGTFPADLAEFFKDGIFASSKLRHIERILNLRKADL